MEMKYIPTIGLEIHAELKTRTKMFCGCKNNPDEGESNKNICPICLAHPGTLPFINKEAVKSVLKVGVAVGGDLADYTEFDRKNYFYPDIPKGFQISQYKYPLVSGGELCGVKIKRIHLEEDTGTSIHDRGDFSLVDYNRAGVPLMELVTEPVIHDSKTAGNFARELQLLLRSLTVSDANMEKGEMRVEVNISVSSGKKLGTKVEVKNINSFRSAERAIDYEIARQVSIVESGGRVVQETRGWDEAKQSTFSQRQKEESHDYRYFPEPDLPKLFLSKIPWASRKEIEKELPELPAEKRKRYVKNFGIRNEDAEIYASSEELGAFFEKVSEIVLNKSGKEAVRIASNYIVSDVSGLVKIGGDLNKILPEEFGKIIAFLLAEKLSSRGVKDVLSVMIGEGGRAEEIIKKLGVYQVEDEMVVDRAIDKVLSVNSKVADDYKKGKLAALQYLIGQVMKEMKGAGKPSVVSQLLKKRLG